MPERKSRTECLIVADGEVIVRSALAEYLRHCGYKVFEAATSDEVVTILEGSTSKIDAILADADISGAMNAFQLRVWAREHHAIQMVLAGNIDTAARAAGELCDAGPHLKRPYDPEAVAQHIKRLLASAQGPLR